MCWLETQVINQFYLKPRGEKQQLPGNSQAIALILIFEPISDRQTAKFTYRTTPMDGSEPKRLSKIMKVIGAALRELAWLPHTSHCLAFFF